MTTLRPTLSEIESRILQALPGAGVEVLDESEQHLGHAGAASGAGHFRVRVVSARFEGLRTVARHRLVYDAVRDWMPTRIHALAIEARSASEASPPSPPG